MSSNIFKPFKIKLEKDRPYFWCTCGLSENHPLCDGKNKNSEYKPLNFKVEETNDYFLCGCKKTKKQPFCDGSHK